MAGGHRYKLVHRHCAAFAPDGSSLFMFADDGSSNLLAMEHITKIEEIGEVSTYYGFKSANNASEQAWFHSVSAAMLFARASGWDIAPLSMESCEDPDRKYIMDTEQEPWTTGKVKTKL